MENGRLLEMLCIEFDLVGEDLGR